MLSDDMNMVMMPMWFTTSWPFNILFQSWQVTDNASYTWSFFVVLFMGLFRHIIIVFRSELAIANYSCCPPMDGLLDDDDDRSKNPPRNGQNLGLVTPLRLQGRLRRYLFSPFLQRNSVLYAFIDMVIFGGNATLGFLNMLVVMTYNPGMMMAVIVGEMLGVLLFEIPGGCGDLESRDHSCH